MGFDFQLNGIGTTAPRVVIGTPANHQHFVAPASVPIEAFASAGSARTVASMEFFANGTKIGDAASAPFRVTWSNAPFGSHIVMARAVDNFGAGITSAPVQIAVGYPLVTLDLVPANSIWKYLDNGSNQGTNWSQRNFNDTSWASGPAELGYGDSGEGFPEATVVSFGPSSSSKYITTYFRRAFVVPPDTTITNLTFRLLRDDGAVVWLNGREVYRSNMPNGTVAYLTPASSAVGDEDEQTYFSTRLATTNVTVGTNIIAVEIHQQAANSSDLSFDLHLAGEGFVLSAVPPGLAAVQVGGGIQLIWPADAAGFQLHSSSQLGAGAFWQPVPGMPATSNGVSILMVAPTNEATFFRLQKP
jgi:hypothetical protein